MKQTPIASHNPYAPPKSTDGIDTILEHDGYSERCMLLCNSHFKSPLVCVTSGVDLTEETAVSVEVTLSRKQPPLLSSPLRVGSWVLRACLLAFVAMILSDLASSKALIAFTICGVVVLCLSFIMSRATAVTAKVTFYISKKCSRSRWRNKVGVFIMALILVSSLVFLGGATAGILFFVCCFISPSFILALIPLRKIRSNGEYVYFRGAHPHYLAQLPLRGGAKGPERVAWGLT